MDNWHSKFIKLLFVHCSSYCSYKNKARMDKLQLVLQGIEKFDCPIAATESLTDPLELTAHHTAPAPSPILSTSAMAEDADLSLWEKMKRLHQMVITSNQSTTLIFSILYINKIMIILSFSAKKNSTKEEEDKITKAANTISKNTRPWISQNREPCVQKVSKCQGANRKERRVTKTDCRRTGREKRKFVNKRLSDLVFKCPKFVNICMKFES